MKMTFLKPGCKFTQLAALLLIGLSSCSEQTSVAPVATTASGKVIIKGSNTLGEELAPRLIAEYKKDHPTAVFELESKATGYGLAALMAGQCDLAGASREPIKEELETAESRNIQLNDHVIGYYGVAVVVNATNPVSSLTREQVHGIFTGAIHNWKEVGGADAPIHLFIRDPISGTYLGFRELAMDNHAYASGATTATNYAGIHRGVAHHANGIGYCSFDLATKADVKALTIQDVPPNAASVREGKYPYTRALHYYTQKGAESEAARNFIEFVQSARGQEILGKTGFVPRL